MVATLKTATKELKMRKMTRAELSFIIVLLWSLSMSKNLGWTNSLENISSFYKIPVKLSKA